MNYQVMPPLTADDFDTLRADIAARGVMVPVEYDDAGNVLDGHHRIRACQELGITDWPRMIRQGLTEPQKRAHARALNLARRHLTQEQRRELIREQLKDTPGTSDRQIAKVLGVSDKTVGSQRSALEERAEIPHVTQVTDTLGREQPRHKETPFPREETEEQGGLRHVSTFIDYEVLERMRPQLPDTQEPQPDPATLPHNHRAQGTGENEWYTPERYIEAARLVLGSFDLDPASSELANEKVKADTFYSEDGQHKEWHGRVFVNPPYSQPAIAEFCEKLASEWESGNIKSAISLTHNYTDTAWFHRLANSATAICFTRGRISFEAPDGKKAAPTQGQAFCYFGDDPMRFSEVFSEFGIVLCRL